MKFMDGGSYVHRRSWSWPDFESAVLHPGHSLLRCRCDEVEQVPMRSTGTWLALSLASVCLRVCSSLRFVLPTLFLCTGGVTAAVHTVTVNTSTAAINPKGLSSEFLAETTSQWNASWKPGIFANSWTVTISSKKPGGPGGSIDPKLITLDSVTQDLIKVSTQNYVNGWANGMSYERRTTLESTAYFYNLCFSTSNAYAVMPSSAMSRETCTSVVAKISQAISKRDLSDPVPMPGF